MIVQMQPKLDILMSTLTKVEPSVSMVTRSRVFFLVIL